MNRFFYLVSVLTVTLCVWYYPTTKDPVCIIGAGPAGLAAAARLESIGRGALIFERQGQVGGKCQSLYDNDTFIPLGAFLYSSTTYKETQKLIDSVEVTPVTFVSGEKWNYNWTTGDISRAPALPAHLLETLNLEFKEYVAWWKENFSSYNFEAGYKNGIPEEFSVSTAEWFLRHQYKVLPLVFSKIMVAYGYGDIRQVPIIYMLQYFTPDVAQTMLRVSQSQPVQIIDFQEVLTRQAQALKKTSILLNSRISKIDRTGRTPIISYINSGATLTEQQREQQQTCSAVILAFPPTIRALEEAKIDLTISERSVFDHVRVNNYWAGAVYTDLSHGVSMTAQTESPMLPPEAVGQPVTILKLQDKSDITTIGSWAALNSNISSTEAYDTLLHTLRSVSHGPLVASKMYKPVGDGHVVSFSKVDYFPHFASPQLTGGLYAKFLAIQGGNQTYWASGLNMFELVEYAIRAGQDVVDSYL